MITANAVKGGLSTFGLKTRVIAPVIVNPQAKEEGSQPAAVDDGACGEVEHERSLARMQPKKKRRVVRRFAYDL